MKLVKEMICISQARIWVITIKHRVISTTFGFIED